MAKRTTRTIGVEQHVALGRQLFRIRNELLAIGGDVAGRLGKTSRVSRRVMGMVRGVDAARVELDGAFFREHPAAYTPRTYYPGNTSPTHHSLADQREVAGCQR